MGGKPKNLSSVESMYREMRAAALGSTGVGANETSQAGTFTEITPWVGVIALRTPTLPPATRTNCYIVGDRELVVVDPATPESSEQAALDQVLGEMAQSGRHVVAVWLTHHHGDHMADAARLAARHRVPIGAHPETAKRLPGVPITVLLNDGDRLELAGEPRAILRAVFTPGHAPGHLCFVEEKSQLCIAGDMVAGLGSILIDPSEGDMIEYLASLRRLASLELQALLPAHGPVLDDPKAALFGYVAHRLWREGRVIDALAGDAGANDTVGESVQSLLPKVYSDVPTMLYPLAARSLLSHLRKLEVENLATSQGGLWKRVEG